MLTITRYIQGQTGENQCHSEKIGDSSNLARPDKESINNTDLSNVVLRVRALKFQRRKLLSHPSYNHSSTYKFYNALKVILCYSMQMLVFLSLCILFGKSYFFDISFFKNTELRTFQKFSEKYDLVTLHDYLGIFVVLTRSGIKGNLPGCAVPAFVLCTSFW